VLGNLFAQPLSMSSLVYLLVDHLNIMNFVWFTCQCLMCQNCVV